MPEMCLRILDLHVLVVGHIQKIKTKKESKNLKK